MTERKTLPDIVAFLRTLRGYPDRVVAEAATAAAERIVELEKEREEWEGVWPKWALAIRAKLHEFGMVTDDEDDTCDLPEVFAEWVDGYEEVCNRRADELEASLAAIRSRIDVEGMATVLEPWSMQFNGYSPYVESRRRAVRAKAQALRTLILGEEVEEQYPSRASLPSVAASDARTETPSPAGRGEL